MRWSRILWALLAVFIVILMIAPMASYCLGRDQDYQDRVGYIAPRPAPVTGALVAATSGPRFVYVKTGPRRLDMSRAVVPGELVMYDIGAGKQLWSKTITGSSATLIGDRILLTNPLSVWMLNADGSDGGVVFSMNDFTSSISGVAGSPDARTIFISTVLRVRCEAPNCPANAGVLWLLDATTYQVLRKVELDTPTFGATWRSDGRGVVVTYGVQHGRPNDRATLFLDGRLVIHDVTKSLRTSPDGTRTTDAPEASRAEGCLFPWGTRMVIREIETGRELAAVEVGTGVLAGHAWAPDSKEYLVATRPTFTNERGTLLCNMSAKDEWLLVEVDSGRVRPVTDVDQVYTRWYGNRLVEMRDCPEPDNPGTTNEELACFGMHGARSDGSLYVGGKYVGTGESFGIVGFID